MDDNNSSNKPLIIGGTLVATVIAGVFAYPKINDAITASKIKASKYDVISVCDEYGVAASCNIDAKTKAREDLVLFHASKAEYQGKSPNIVKNIKCGNFDQITMMLDPQAKRDDIVAYNNDKGCKLPENDLNAILDNRKSVIVTGGWTITKEREKKVDFLPTLYYVKQTLYSRNEDKRTVEELLASGEKVGIQSGTTIEERLKEIAKEKGGTLLNNVKTFSDVGEIEKSLKANTIHHFISDDVGVEGNEYLKSFKPHTFLTDVKGIGVTNEPISIFVSKDSEIKSQLMGNIKASNVTMHSWMDDDIKSLWQ